MDIVYIYKHSQANDLEIRLSLRSVARFYPTVGKVWIFGDRPHFLAEDTTIVEHVPADSLARALEMPTPIANLFRAMFVSSLIPDLSPEYLFFSDDFFLLREYTPEAVRTIRYLEDLDKVEIRGKGLWIDALWRTYELLKRLGYPRLNFETHTPTYLRKKWVFDAYADLKDFTTADRWYGMLGPTSIMNHVLAKQSVELPLVSIRHEGARAGFWDAPPKYEDVAQACEGKLFFNCDDKAFGPDVRRYLLEQFATPCKYEKPDADAVVDGRATATCFQVIV